VNTKSKNCFKDVMSDIRACETYPCFYLTEDTTMVFNLFDSQE